jgi:hypothetical protein
MANGVAFNQKRLAHFAGLSSIFAFFVRSVSVLALLLFAAASPAEELPAWVVNLARLKQSARAMLGNFPNYVCRETIDRYRGSQGSSPRVSDIIELEVAVVDGKEMFALPSGARPHQKPHQKNLGDYVSRGLIGDGVFQGLAHNLLATELARFHWGGEEEIHPRTKGAAKSLHALRYDFELSALFGPYILEVDRMSGSTGLRGSLWVDAGSLDLLRVEASAVEIPPQLASVEGFRMTIDYARVRLGTSDALLPAAAEMNMKFVFGQNDRNFIEFSGCREFTSESTIDFYDVSRREAPEEKKRK